MYWGTNLPYLFHYMGKSLKEQNTARAFPLYFSDTSCYTFLTLPDISGR